MGGFNIYDILIDNPANLMLNIDMFIKDTKKYDLDFTDFNKVGITFKFKDNGIYVSKIKKDSIADKKNIIVGLKLLEINNINIYDYQLKDIYELLINKCTILFGIEDKNKKQYNWNYRVRVVQKNGKVTKIGTYDGYGYVYLNNQYFEINYHSYKYKNYKKKLGKQIILELDKNNLIIHDIVYKYMKSHKDYKKLKNINLYEKLIEFAKSSKRDTLEISKYVGDQNIYIEDYNYKNNFINSNDTILQGKNDYFLVDPEINKKNKNRIIKLVNNFIAFAQNN